MQEQVKHDCCRQSYNNTFLLQRGAGGGLGFLGCHTASAWQESPSLSAGHAKCRCSLLSRAGGRRAKKMMRSINLSISEVWMATLTTWNIQPCSTLSSGLCCPLALSLSPAFVLNSSSRLVPSASLSLAITSALLLHPAYLGSFLIKLSGGFQSRSSPYQSTQPCPK